MRRGRQRRGDLPRRRLPLTPLCGRSLLVIGAGELGGRVARTWVQGGGSCTGVTRSTARHPTLQASGVTARCGVPESLEGFDTLLLAVPGSAAQRDVIRSIRHLQPPKRVVLIGTTGIYGGRGGVVDETSPVGGTERASIAAEAELAVRQWQPHAAVLRCGGLYRLGRGPAAALVRRGAPPVGPPDKTLALIHYEDAAMASLAALARERVRPTYLVVTPPCPSRREFYEAACAHAGLAPPTFHGTADATTYDVTALRGDLLPSPAWPAWAAAARG